MNEQLKYWLALNRILELGPVTIKKFWEHFGSAKAIWEASENEVRQIEGIYMPAVKAFLENRKNIDIEKELERLQGKNIKVLTLEDEEYPFGLKNIYDPPPVLYIKGDILKTDGKALAIVGTRKASRYGLETAKKLAYELAALGITIVSGMAEGIDTAAHTGALAAKGRTLAVFGCGVDVIFPKENKKLSDEIAQSGALVSEFPIGAGTEKGNFPRRNRIISGLSIGVVVVEGHYDSGAMITAKLALDQGREVFAVPGNIEMEQSKGPHWLIKQGAKLVETVDDVLEELNIAVPKRMTNDQLPMTNEGRDYSNLSYEEKKIVAVLSMEPKYIDNIAIESGLSVPQVSSSLLILEIKNLIRQLPGKMFVLS